MRTIFITALMIAMLSGTSLGKLPKIPAPDIAEQIKDSAAAIQKAKDEAARERAKRLEDEKKAAAKQEAAKKAAVDAAEAQKALEERRLKEVMNLEELRKSAESQLEVVSKLQSELAATRLSWQKAQGDLTLKEEDFKDKVKIFDLEKEQYELEKKLAKQKEESAKQEEKSAKDSEFKWWLTFCVTLTTAIVGAAAAIYEIVKCHHEINAIKQAKTPSAGHA